MREQDQAEDIIQEVFIDLWRRMDQLDILNHRAYLYKAVKFQCATRLKKRDFKQVHLESIESAIRTLDESNHSYEDLKSRLLQQIETKAVELLPDRCLRIFQLRYYENKSYLEIAHLLGISVRTVENQLNKALKVLRSEHKLIVMLVLSEAALSQCVM